MANIIKGLTVEIGGDTTKLGKALEAVNKKSRDLSAELGQINKLLKLDTGNVDLLTQKQKVLSDAISNTRDKLDRLKAAEKQVQAQFERGEVSEEQVRALRREIIETEKKLGQYEQAAKETADAIDDVGDAADNLKNKLKKTGKETDDTADDMEELEEETEDAGEAADDLDSKLGGLAKGGLTLLAAGLTAAVGALTGCAEATRDYRAEMGKLETAFTTADHSSGAATAAYKELQGVIGETDQSVEAAQQIALLAESEEDVAHWAGLAAGVVGRFGDALQPETFYESANETLKLGEATGAYVQMIEGAGGNVDDFNAGLAACTTEAEKQAYMLQYTEQYLGEAADAYRETNADIIDANKANEEWMETMAEVGGVVEPLLTEVKLLGASLLSDLVPGITEVVNGFKGMLNGEEGAAEDMGEALSGIVEQLLSTLTNMLPDITSMAVSLIGTLSSSLIDMAPELLSAGVEIAMALLDGVTEAAPDILESLTSMLPELLTEAVSALQTNLPLILESVLSLASSLITMLSEQLPTLIPMVVDTVVSLVNLLVEQLPVILPQIVTLAVDLVSLLVETLPTLIPHLVDAVVSIIELIAEQLPSLVTTLTDLLVGTIELLVEQLPVIIPMLIDACISIVSSLISALPGVLIALTDALPGILAAVWDAIVMVFEELPAWFGQIFQGAWDLIVDVFAGLGEWFGSIWDDVVAVFAGVGDWFSEIFSGAWEGIKDIFSGVGDWFGGIWENIKAAFGSVADWFGDIFSDAWEAVKGVFTTTGEVFLNIGTGILDALKIVVNAIIEGLNTVIALPFDGLNGILETIHGISFFGISPFSWLTWRAPVPQIPKLEKGGVLAKGQIGLLEGSGAEAVVPLERTEWIQKVAREFVAQVKNAAAVDFTSHSPSAANTAMSMGGLTDKLDKILAAIEAGQILTIDGRTFVGATAHMTDDALGQRRVLAARGAV